MDKAQFGRCSKRSREPLTREHLARLAEIARDDREAQFARGRSWAAYRDRLLCVALCQGAALHFIDRVNGVKDLDVWTFFAELPGRTRPEPGLYRRRAVIDFGPSALGRHPDDHGFRGRRVDLMARALRASPDEDPQRVLLAWLSEGRTTSSKRLAAKVVVLIEPNLWTVVWPGRALR